MKNDSIKCIWRISIFFSLKDVFNVIIMWKGYVIKIYKTFFSFSFLGSPNFRISSYKTNNPFKEKEITSLSRKLFIVRISPVYLLIINMGESEGSWLMILKAIFEFKLFGSSASVALSLITNVSRNQGKLIANGQFAFLFLYVIV